MSIKQHDEKQRTIAVPPVLKKALAKSPEVKAIFNKLPYSHQKEYVQWIEQARQAETAQRRIEKLIPMLSKKARAEQK